jgi:hypothetical protein
MAWAKFDDRFHDNRRIRRAWRRCPAAIGLFAMSITYASGHKTDGHVPIEFVEDQFRRDRDMNDAVAALVDAGLWADAEDGWTIPRFLSYNPPAAEASQAAAKRSEAARKAANARWNRNADACDSDASPHAETHMRPVRSDAPVPSRPDPTPPFGVGESSASTGRDAFVGSVDDVADVLRRVPEWDSALHRGAITAVDALVSANRDVPWLEIAAEVVASRLDPDPRSLRTNSPRQALDMRLADHRSGRRGGEGRVVGSRKRNVRSMSDHLAAVAARHDEHGNPKESA